MQIIHESNGIYYCSTRGTYSTATLRSQDALTIQPCLLSSLYHPHFIMVRVKIREVETGRHTFPVFCFVAKQPSVRFHSNVLGLLAIAMNVFNFIFLIGSWKQYPFQMCCCSPFSRAVNMSVDASGDATVPVEMITRSEGSFPKWFVQLFFKGSTIEAAFDSSIYTGLFKISMLCDSTALNGVLLL